MHLLKTNTAVRVVVGPFLDATDGVTPETSLTVTNSSCELYYEDDDGTAPHRTAITLSASGGDNDMVHVTDDVGGWYGLELTAAQLNFVGRMRLSIIDTDVHCPVFVEYMVVPAKVYASLVEGSDNLEVDAIQISGSATAANNAEVVFDTDFATNYNTTTDLWQVNTVSLTANSITATAIADDAIAAAKLATGAITADAFAADAIVAATLATGALTADAFAANAITNAAVADDVDVNVKTITNGAITAAAIATDAIDADAIAATGAAEIADAVWDEAATGHTDAGKAGAQFGLTLTRYSTIPT